MDSKKLASGRALPLRVCRYIACCFAILFTPYLLADGLGSADVLDDQVCMQDRAGFDLGCTANDISIAGVENLQILDDGCAYPGDEVTFRADFRVLLTAQERHDVGLWFALDGDPNSDGALSGTCTVATPAYAPSPSLDLDGMNDGGFCSDGRTSCKVDRDCKGIGNGKCTLEQDTCGDIDGNHNPLFPGVTLTVKCVAGNEAGDLLVPNCTSWRQPGSNDLCTSPLDAFPGAPSKCKCDNGFTVPIKVPPAVLKVTKTAKPDEVMEPGGDVTYTVTVTNVGIDPNNGVILTSLIDSIYGDITTVYGDIKETNCDVGGSIPSDDGQLGGIDTYTCSFVVSVSGNARVEIPDTVTASAIDARGNTLSGYDDAKVTITDVQPEIDVTKAVSPDKLAEPGGKVTFTVTVTNKSSASSDPVTITTLMDNTDGAIEDLKLVCLDANDQTLVGQTIPAGGSVSCTFMRDVTGNAGYVETDTVTATGTDDEGNPAEDSDSATVTIEDVPSSITLTKTASPDSLEEPGGTVDFTVVINNTSSVDAVTINTLTDTIGNDEKPLVDCSPNLLGVTIPAGGSVSCTFSRNLQGQPGNPHVDTVTTTGKDDDGEDVTAADDATVTFKNVIPAAVLSKSATAAVVTYSVTVTNQSDAEALYLDKLSDDKFGLISVGNSEVIETNCSTPQTLQPHGQADDSYSCWFKAEVSCSPHTNTLTGDVNDDDGSATIKPTGTATVTLSGATECDLN